MANNRLYCVNKYTGEYFVMAKYYPCDWSIDPYRIYEFNDWQSRQADLLEKKLGKTGFEGGFGTYFIWCDEQDERIELYDFKNKRIILKTQNPATKLGNV